MSKLNSANNIEDKLMATVQVYNIECKKKGKIELDDQVFGVEPKLHLLHAVVRYQLAKRRAGTHDTKGRTEISGGGRKPFRQKGTGRARAGTIRAPHWRGGGVVFGPTPRSYAFKLNKKVRRSALKGALSQRVRDNALIVLDDFGLKEPKTRNVVEMMKRFELSDMCVVLSEKDELVNKSVRNISGALVLATEGLNVYDILRHKNLVMTKSAVEAVTQRLVG
jgi:large subunit ribosomal protein L4